MFCSKCGANISENASFCGKCGNSLGQPKSKKTKKSSNKKKNKIIIVCIILVVCLIVGVLLPPLVINKIQQKKITEMVNILSDGYWMAMDSENKINMLDYDYDNDFGLIFHPETQSAFGDRFAVTTDGEVLSYHFDSFGKVWTLSYFEDGVSHGFFHIEYDRENDALVLTKSLESDFFDANLEVGKKIYLSHFPDEDENTELEKKLYFEYWSDVDGNYLGTEDVIKDNLFLDNSDATLYRFFKNNNRQFNYCEVSLFEYTFGSNGYTYYPTNYDFSGEYQYNGLNMVGLSFNDSTYEYFRYNEEENCLINDTNGRKIYCVSNNTEF